MCGICGIFNADGAGVNPLLLAKMNGRIRHRGPDDNGSFVDGGVGLAMRRLSIIDVASGHQPIANEDESVWIVYNGEIYNHRELRDDLTARGHVYRTNSDTETIVHLYEEYGRSCVQHLRGMFAFAIWDRAARRLFLARDRLGIKPLYYRWDGQTLLFGSEIKTLLAYPGVNAEFERSVLAEYLAFGYISGPRTMFSGIHKLQPGHTLELRNGEQPLTSCYWDLVNPPLEQTRGRGNWVKAYRERLEQCISSHLMSDVPLGVFLSGGLDSSVVAALATKARGEPVQTFSVGYEEETFSELPYARAVARHLRSDHREVKLRGDEFFEALPMLIWHEDEPLAWPSSVSLYFAARLAGAHVKVVLTGEGSDETLAGYQRYAWTLMNTRFDRVYRTLTPSKFRQFLRDQIRNGPLPPALSRKLGHTFLARDGQAWTSMYFDNFYSAFTSDEQEPLLTDELRTAVEDPYAWPVRYWEQYSGDLLHTMLYADIKTYLHELLMKQDQMSMAASIESRVPFLDHRLVEFTAGIPKHLLVQGTSGKHILKAAAADLLPRDIIHRRKMGFPTPWARWLAGEHLNRVQDILMDPRAIERNLFCPEAIWRLLDEQRNGARDHTERLWRLLNLEIWHRVFIDEESFAQV